MAGTIGGGIKLKATMLKRDPDYYKKLGKLNKGTKKKTNMLRDIPGRASDIGKLGGQASVIVRRAMRDAKLADKQHTALRAR